MHRDCCIPPLPWHIRKVGAPTISPLFALFLPPPECIVQCAAVCAYVTSPNYVTSTVETYPQAVFPKLCLFRCRSLWQCVARTKEAPEAQVMRCLSATNSCLSCSQTCPQTQQCSEMECHMCSAASNNAEVAAATTIADLQAASKGLQNKGGPDPLTAVMQVTTPVLLTSIFAVPIDWCPRALDTVDWWL